MKSRLGIIILFVIFSLFSCKEGKSKSFLRPGQEARYLVVGDSISAAVQGELLRNVSRAIQQGGRDNAVEFCHLRAMPLTDSLSAVYNVTIQRLTDKNRNPQNAIRTLEDHQAWERIKNENTDFIERDQNGKVQYYKPIVMGMPTCIQCHGTRSDISESTRNIIHIKYPEDRATSYALGDLRGMWKIEFDRK